MATSSGQHAAVSLSFALALWLVAALAVPVLAQDRTPEIAIGTPIAGQLTLADRVGPGDSTHYQVFKFTGTVGQTVQIDLTSNDFDAFLVLFNQNGREITHDDDSGGGLNARIIQTLTYTGLYLIVATTAIRDETGAFTLQLRVLNEGQVPQEPATPQAGGWPVTARVPIPEGSMRSLAVASDASGETRVYMGGGAARGPAVSVLDARTLELSTVGPGAGVSVDQLTGRYWAAGLYDGDVLVRDGRSNRLLAAIPTRYCPFATAVDAVRRRAWVAAQCGPGNDPVWAINADSYAIVAGPIASGGVMSSLVVNPATGRVYLATGEVSKRIDPSRSYRVTQNSFGQVLGADARTGRLYAMDESGLQVIDGESNPEVLLATIALAYRPQFVAVDTTSNEVLVGSSARRSIDIVDGATHSLIGSIALAPDFSPLLIATDPTSRGRVFVVGVTPGGPSLAILRRP